MSISQLRSTDALAAYTYRDVAQQFDEIYRHIEGVKDAK